MIIYYCWWNDKHIEMWEDIYWMMHNFKGG